MSAVIALVRPRCVRAAVLAIALFAVAFASSASVFVSVNFAPPPLPVYAQPICPGPGYVWVPGYWAYGPEGYYWVPGTWVLAPYVGALWTPGYWGWSGTLFVWHPGYWGPHVGFYGGIDYGFGYFGVGYVGGYWNRGAFYYNTAVTNVNLSVVHNTYRRDFAARNAAVSRVSFNGGAGGILAQPTAQDRLAASDHHRAATAVQVQHERLASTNRSLLASVNHGAPSLATTPRAAAFGSRAATGSASAGRAPLAASSHTGREPRVESNAPRAASTHPSRDFRAETNVAHGAPPRVNRDLRTEHAAPHANTGSPQVQRFSPERHAQATPQIQERPASEHRVQHAPQLQSNTPAPEHHAFNAPRTESMPAPQFHAQNAPRMQSMPAPERHAEGGPRPQGQPHPGRGGEKSREEGPGR